MFQGAATVRLPLSAMAAQVIAPEVPFGYGSMEFPSTGTLTGIAGYGDPSLLHHSPLLSASPLCLPRILSVPSSSYYTFGIDTRSMPGSVAAPLGSVQAAIGKTVQEKISEE